MPTLTIDGREVTVPKGTSVLEAAKLAGIFIPHYCYHPALAVVGNCRMCLVKIDRFPKLQTSCSTEAADQMKVFTATEEVQKAQKAVMEFLLVNHPLDCPVCDQGGECDLQDFSYRFGAGESRYEFARQTFAERNLGPVIKLNMNRCIRCTRCVRFCSEVRGKSELDFFYRGQHSELGTFDGQDLTGSLQGNLIDICPVGALTSKDYRFKSRPWENRTYRSVCPFCEKGCSITLTVKWMTNQILRVLPRYNPDVNGHFMCDHGRFGYHALLEGRRVRDAAVRTGADFMAVPLEDAYGVIYERARQLRERHGGGVFFGLGSPHASNEDNFMLARFLGDAFGCTQFDVNSREDMGQGEDYPRFRIPSYKAPNLTGARDAGMAGLGIGYDGLRAAIERGDVKALFVLPGNRFSDLKGDFDFLRRLDLLVLFELLPSPIRDVATVSLPAAAWTESDGTFTNMDGRIQHFQRGMEPRGATIPVWRALAELGKRFGLQGYQKLQLPEHVFLDMASRVSGYSGLDYAALGDRGVLKGAGQS